MKKGKGIMTKHIFVTGGVISGLGKGIAAASLGRLLKQRGLKVASQKLDPYMNVDPGMMSPFQHGEVFVTDDGAETDQDLGHYERFIDENLTKLSNLTAGKVYWNVLEREREGGYAGGTVQIIPHVTEEIKNFIYSGAETSGADILLTEIGGTAGDIECQPFLEAIRQIALEKGYENCLFIHLTLVPYLKATGEHKSKPTQHSVKELRAMGINPNIIVARTDEPISDAIKKKISLFCNVKPDCVIENITVPILYEAPLRLHDNGLDEVVCRELGIDAPESNLDEWRMMVHKSMSLEKTAEIALVGKYVQLQDAYCSITESLKHAGFEAGADIKIRWIDSVDVNSGSVGQIFEGVHGILVPGGFGERGVEGMIAACRYARENDIPYLGISLGLQTAVIEFARNVCGLDRANSREFDETSAHCVIDYRPGQSSLTGGAATMRLGAFPCKVKPDTLLGRLYGTEGINERHRHRFEFNNKYRELLDGKGMIISGTSPDGLLAEAVELPSNRFFVAVQFHPEFKSRPNRPHPLFLGFIRAALDGCE